MRQLYCKQKEGTPSKVAFHSGFGSWRAALGADDAKRFLA